MVHIPLGLFRISEYAAWLTVRPMVDAGHGFLGGFERPLDGFVARLQCVVIGALEGPFTYNDTGAQLGGEKLPSGSLSACSPMREQVHD